MRKARADPGTLMVPAPAPSLSPSKKAALTFHTLEPIQMSPPHTQAETWSLLGVPTHPTCFPLTHLMFWDPWRVYVPESHSRIASLS